MMPCGSIEIIKFKLNFFINMNGSRRFPTFMCYDDHLFISGVKDLISAYNKLHSTTNSSTHKDAREMKSIFKDQIRSQVPFSHQNQF